MLTRNAKASKIALVTTALTWLTAASAWAEDDIPPIHQPLHWTEKLVIYVHDAWQFLMGFLIV